MRVSVIRLSLGRRLVNLLPVAQRTNAFTNRTITIPGICEALNTLPSGLLVYVVAVVRTECTQYHTRTWRRVSQLGTRGGWCLGRCSGAMATPGDRRIGGLDEGACWALSSKGWQTDTTFSPDWVSSDWLIVGYNGKERLSCVLIEIWKTWLLGIDEVVVNVFVYLVHIIAYTYLTQTDKTEKKT